MDVRFLKNPHWELSLRAMSGLDEPVQDFIAADPDFADFMARLQALLARLLPRYVAEGKNYLTIALGCTGGRHRSVYSVEILKAWLTGQGFETLSLHRDLRL